MKGRFWRVAAVALAANVVLAPIASADDLVQFETTSTGTRTVTLAVAPAFSPTTDLALSQEVSTVTPASVEVTEVFKTGNSWSVKAQMCGPDSYASPTAGDCVNKANRMERADGDFIPGSDIDVAHGAPVVVLGGGTTTSGSETTLGGQITLLNNTGQSPLTTYNGVYASTTNLSIDELSEVGVWKGMWVVTQTL